ncbi:replicative DNA helicase [Inquilinus sp.]|jgi:replicative DNA helicase|uniref:replicative DNA helicase n=1 Tax=Inquilinus sp. TaxID=1932117 RepID=UPI00378387A1
MEKFRPESPLTLVHNADPMASPTYRRMPANEEAEQALLGAILANNAALEKASDFLRPEHFYVPAHGRIYGAAMRLAEQNRIADPISLKQYFETDNELEGVGGAQYLTDLAASVVSVMNAEDYAQTIYDLSLRRQLILAGEEIVNDAYKLENEMDGPAQIQEGEEKLYRLSSSGVLRKDFEPFGDVLARAVDAAGKALERDTPLTGVTTGLAEIDKMMGGLQPSDLIVLAGRPGMGKTALATNMAFNAATAYLRKHGKEGAVVGFFSMEMSSDQLAVRILSEVAEIASERIRKGDMKRSDFPRVVEAANLIRQTPFFIDDTAGVSISTLRTRAMRLKRQHNLGMLVVDYIQLMSAGSTKKNENRVQEISEITRGLKILAKDLSIPVIALSQLSRQVENREDKRPQLSDLRESGSIEQDADVVMFVYREAYYLSKGEPPEGTPEHQDWMAAMDRVHNVAEVIVAKQRHGPTGTRRLHFEGQYTKFSNLQSDPSFDDQ